MGKAKRRPLNAVIAANVRLLRIERGLTITKLARLVGCTKSQMQRLERGERRWNSQWLEWTAVVLSVRVERLVRR